jgi:predicted aconitase
MVSMQLDDDDKCVLAGEYGETRQKMMEILVALGKVFGAERLVRIRSAQVSGASYKTIGKYGLDWLRSLDARVVVPTVLNPIGMDRERWQDMGIPEDFSRKQQEVITAYQRLGIRLECTCTPYELTSIRYGEHLAWSESSAVAYANSAIGARTNREGGPSALAAAIIGKTPCYGLHLLANRHPQLIIDPPSDFDWDPAKYGALGYLAGRLAGNRIPFFRGIRPDADSLKALGAAMAATGAVALFHVEGITPESRIFRYEVSELERFSIESGEIDRLFSAMPVEAVAIGCPHCSPRELHRLAELLAGKKITRPLYIFTARGVRERNPGVVNAIEQSGARVYADTCMVVSPAMEQYGTIMVNSGKALAYVPDMCGALVRMGTTEECIETATT